MNRNLLVLACRAACLAAAVLGLAGPAGAQQRPATPGADSVATYTLSAVEELPRPTNTADFVRTLMRGYPPALRRAGVTGTVQVRFRVLEDGRVDRESVQVTRSTDELFNEPGIRAVNVLRFRPAKVGGRPVRVWMEIPVQFSPPGRG